MEEMGFIKLVIDAGFVVAVVYLCHRTANGIRGNTSLDLNLPDPREVEHSIKSVVAEAEVAGRELTKELAKRQRSLEQILFDLETTESKIVRAVDQAEQRIIEIEAALQLQPQTSETTSENESQELDINENEVEEVEVMSNEDSSDPLVVEVVSNQAGKQKVEEVTLHRNDSTKYNIFGEPVGIDKAETTTPLSSKIIIEREPARRTSVIPQGNHLNDQQQKIKEIYRKARALLETGNDVATVMSMTRLPIDAVEKIKATIESDHSSEAVVASSIEPRLGVLGSMRRNTQRI